MSSVASGNPASGIFIRLRYSSLLGATVKGNWTLVCRNAGTETTVDLGVTAGTAKQLLEFRITNNGAKVQAYVNGTPTGAAITTNIPTGLLIAALDIVDYYAGGIAGLTQQGQPSCWRVAWEPNQGVTP